MRASDVMVQQVVKIKEHDSLKEAIDKMIQHRLNMLPVINERNEILGCISIENILQWLGRNHVYYDFFTFFCVYLDQEPLDFKICRLLQRNAIEVISRNTAIVSMDEDVCEVASLLSKKRARCVMVEGNGVLKGVISPHDLIRGLFHKEYSFNKSE